jgi:hypothetical protein
MVYQLIKLFSLYHKGTVMKEKLLTAFIIRILFIAACVSPIVAQNNDAPESAAAWNGKTYYYNGNRYTTAINFNDTSIFSTSWKYMALGWQWTYALPRITNKCLSVNVQPGSVDL